MPSHVLRRLRAGGAIAVVLLAGACVSQGPLPSSHGHAGGAGAARELATVPFFPQADFQCGPAALATVLVASGVSTTPGALAGQVYLPARRGSLQAELVAATRRHERMPYVLEPSLAALAAEVAAGRPAVVLQDLGIGPWARWHYAVVVGVSPDRIVLRSGPRERLVMSARSFDRTWRAAGRWAFVALRPGELPARPEARQWLRASAALEEVGLVAHARENYATATRTWPQDPFAWLALGNAEYRMARRVEAERAYRAALALAPGEATVRNNLAQVLLERGCLAEAARHAAEAQRTAGPQLRDGIGKTAGAIAARRAQAGAGAEPAECVATDGRRSEP